MVHSTPLWIGRRVPRQSVDLIDARPCPELGSIEHIKFWSGGSPAVLYRIEGRRESVNGCSNVLHSKRTATVETDTPADQLDQSGGGGVLIPYLFSESLHSIQQREHPSDTHRQQRNSPVSRALASLLLFGGTRCPSRLWSGSSTMPPLPFTLVRPLLLYATIVGLNLDLIFLAHLTRLFAAAFLVRRLRLDYRTHFCTQPKEARTHTYIHARIPTYT